MLGLFDSGLGGLSVVRRVRELLPRHDLLFFADQAHVPYGDRDEADLARLLHRNVAWLDAEGCDAIVMACNTSCAIADVRGWPASNALVIDLIESAAIEIQRSGFERIGVIATSATAASGAYGRKIRERVPGADVREIAAPALVPLVEADLADSREAGLAVQAACAALDSDVQAVILACTHFPFLDAHFARALAPHVRRIDPALVQAERTAELVERHGLAAGSGTTRYVTNGDSGLFAENVERLMKRPAIT